MTARDWTPGESGVTAGDVYSTAVEQRTQEGADAHMAKCITHAMLVHGQTEEEAKKDFLHGLGYWIGYFSSEDAKRVRHLYRTQHPIFGDAIETDMTPLAMLAPSAPTPPTPAEAERIRIRHQLARMRSHVEALELTLADSCTGTPPGPEAGQTITQAAGSISTSFARLDAFMRVEEKART